ncbi:oxygen-independent coproporphyrinogen III oxidase [Sinorhizobium meliloti]|uniref:oxygen-independent coproporphyrinogen III oxidase n=1 Tax=Rhizobium meliloti TaxID=382 RepID=UPI000FD2262C|nr:oxygen-independent coproporphyrinogen III oxidase [Sinorhizobium meliloti]RVK03546.1 oxygen-independent coproporphyrinogen III oxidase [Sinorhizobium meliloti]RVL44465.1 oxygen-independent coproporphyrinogen III oxidase [Sinorhizobium meliloti]RVL72262.1 oxygen-independent coproporphyrinogen III oxidase [Sinorhizobium meliloti]RVP57549.1 oxygen-independent coproporphyrinogen III oxidase [Sinorhizobium meliloti]RVP87944.1 oxygen-independent coproporphyrinogen III oxidase [Sinorhizobium melil
MQPALVAKYGEARLPRYTSYPTAPRFSPAIDANTYGDWLADIAPKQPASLYLHIPFCRSMCWYCGCHTTITQRDQPILDYLDMLREEVHLVSAKTRAPLSIDHVHFGGGTPTIMQPEEFRALVALLRERFEFASMTEIAVEIDPRTLEPEMATALGEAGVRRASLGVQSFDPVVQKAINRIQSEEQTMEAVSRLRQSGVDSINFDLIYGLPHQTVESCIATAQAAIRMGPERFAVFGYAHIPSFKKHQKLIDEQALADAEGRVAQAEAIAATLAAAGYRRIGLDHFALPDDSLAIAQASGRLHRNFQGYTTDACETLIGLGASAIGRTNDGYVQNEVPPGLYAQHIASGRLATVKGYRMTPEDRLRAGIIERLMCDFGVDVPALATAHGFDPEMLLRGNTRLAMLESDGILDIADGVIRLREGRRFLIRAAAAAFDAYIEQSGRTHSKAA